jgi:hypothetical protein
MQHSVKNIGDNYESLSNMRNDDKRFNSNDFLKFAKDNKDKYRLIENGNDFLVSTWYSNDLINDYINSIK